MVDYNKIRSEHFLKRLNTLAGLFDNMDPVLELNTAIIDNNINMIKLSEDKLAALNINYSYDDISYLKNKNKFQIVYLLPHNLATGGLKILLEQAGRLLLAGHHVTLYSHLPKPSWIDIGCRYVQVGEDKHLYEEVPACDIVIAGYWDLILDALAVNAPIKYYLAQGDIDIFENENLSPFLRNTSYLAHRLPVKIITVSQIMKKRLGELYGRESVIVPNAIDSSIFYPSGSKHNFPLKILLMGCDSLDFKGHDYVLKALYMLKLEGYSFKIFWITPTIPSKEFFDGKLNIQYSIKPTQEEIGRILRECDIYISGSYYEAFSLPPLEAMACSTCVISAANDGIKEYAIDNENCLLFKPGDADGLRSRIKLFINSPELIKKLRRNGHKTAKLYSWNRSISCLEKEFKTTACSQKIIRLQ